jgi:hypothetical protein
MIKFKMKKYIINLINKIFKLRNKIFKLRKKIFKLRKKIFKLRKKIFKLINIKKNMKNNCKKTNCINNNKM